MYTVVSRGMLNTSRVIVSCLAGFDAAGLAVAGRVQDQVAEQFAVLGDDTNVEAGGQDQHALCAEPTPMWCSWTVVAQRFPAGVDLVVADPVMGRVDGAACGGAGSGVPCLGRCVPVERAVRSVGVVDGR